MSLRFSTRRLLFVVLIYALIFSLTRSLGMWVYILGAIAGTALACVALTARRGKVNLGAIAVVAVFTLLGIVLIGFPGYSRKSEFNAVFDCALGGVLGAALGVGIRTLIWPPPRKPRKPIPHNPEEASLWVERPEVTPRTENPQGDGVQETS